MPGFSLGDSCWSPWSQMSVKSTDSSLSFFLLVANINLHCCESKGYPVTAGGINKSFFYTSQQPILGLMQWGVPLHGSGPCEHVCVLIPVKMCGKTFNLSAAFHLWSQSSRDSFNLCVKSRHMRHEGTCSRKPDWQQPKSKHQIPASHSHFCSISFTLLHSLV